MAEYKTIKGFKTQSYATDPVAATAAWSSGGALNTSRRIGAMAQTAPTSAGQIAGGGPATSPSANTEQYNGSTWSEVNNMNTARFGLGGTGTQTNAIGMGGFVSPPGYHDNSETWNGTCWAEGNNINSARYQVISAGTGNTSALIAGGEAPPVATSSAKCEKWNGTSWTEVGDLGTARYALSGGGTATAAIAMGGMIGPGPSGPNAKSALVEEWNGSSWSEKADLNTARALAGAAVSDTENALYFAGNAPPTACKLTEKWNGTSWSETSDLSTGRAYANGSGTETAALCVAGGALPPGGTGTEEWADYSGTNPAPSLTMFDEGQIWYNTTGAALKYTALGAGTWASGGAANTGRRYMSIAGTQTSAVTCGGSPPPITATEQYNGTAWTAHPSGTLNSDKHNTGGLGQSDSAAMAVGGAGYLAISETWNGSSWTEGNNITTGRTFAAAGGTTTSAILACGETPGSPNTLNCETYNGTSWTEVANINTSRYLVGHGTASDSATAWFIAGGITSVKTESWDGTSWTEVADLSRSSPNSGAMASSGSSTDGLVFGGYPGVTGLTEAWDGTSWTEVADLATSRYGAGGCGSGTLALCSMGAAPATQTVTEEWTRSLGVKTVTVS